MHQVVGIDMLFTSAVLETWLPVAPTGLRMLRAMPRTAEPYAEFAIAVATARRLGIKPLHSR